MYYYRIHEWTSCITDSYRCILYKSRKAIRKPRDFSEWCYFVERINIFEYYFNKFNNWMVE